MNEASRATDLSSSLNAELEDIVTGIAEQARSGRPIDIDACCRQHPEHADELRRVLPTLQALADFGQAAPDPGNSGGASVTIPQGRQSLGTLGDFQIVREIGRGGMGVVYEAEQISLKRRVALKVLPFAAVLDNRQLQRFRTEAMAAARLHHQHIVPVYQVGCDRAVHFYAMQYIEGRNIAELIRETRRAAGVAGAGDAGAGFTQTDTQTAAENRPVETAKLADISTDYSGNRLSYHRRVATLGVQAAQALDFAHQHGILHRDIKPSNLMLDSEANLWVTDFGLARIEGDEGLTMSGDLLGTLRYMSPEQALGKRVVIDQRTDVYSLGVSLYEMLTLRPAYDGADRAELLRQISFESPAPLRKHDSTIPADLETIVLTAMAREPHRRYETAQELANDLQRFLDGKPIFARRPSRRERVVKWVSRNKPLTVSLVLLLLAVLIAAAAISDALARRTAILPAVVPAAAVPSAEAPPEPIVTARAPGRILPGLVPEPAIIPEVGRWQLITKKPRGVVRSAVWSPDEQSVALAEANHVRIYDARDLRLAQVLIGHSQPVRSVAWHPDGKRLASCSEDSSVRLWTSTGIPTHLLRGHTGPAYQVAWRPDGKQLASAAADGTVRVWSAEGELIHTLDEGGRHVFGIDWSPDGALLASVGGDIRPAGPDGDPGDNALRLWNTETWKLERKIPASVKYSGLCVDWRPDGQQLAVGYGHVYRQMHWTGHPLPDAGVRIWNADGTPGPEVGRDKGSVNTLAWDPKGERLAFAGRVRNVGLWNAGNREAVELDINSKIEFFALSWSRDGTRLLVGDRDGVQEWDGRTKTAALTAGIGRQVSFYDAVWSPDGRMLFGRRTGAGKSPFWTPGGRLLPVLDSPTEEVPPWWERHSPARRPDGTAAPELEGRPTADGYTKFAWSKDGWLAAASWNDQSVRIWDDQGKLIATCLGHRGGVELVAWSPDGKQVVSGGGDSVRIWNRDGTAGPVMIGHTDEVYGVAWSPDGQWIASAGTDSTVRLWKPNGDAGPVLRGHQGGVFGVGWSPDSKKLASASWLDNTLRVWDVAAEKTEWQGLRLDETTTVTVTPEGVILDGDAEVVDASLLYALERRDGSVELIAPAEFRKRFSAQIVEQLSAAITQGLAAREFDRSAAVVTQALAIARDLDAKARGAVAKMAEQLAEAHYYERHYVQAEQEIRRSIEIQQQVVIERPEEHAEKGTLAFYWKLLGGYLSAAGRNAEALTAITTAVDVMQARVAAEPDKPELNSTLARWMCARALRQPTQDAALADLNRAIEVHPTIDTMAWEVLYFLDDIADEAHDQSAANPHEIAAAQQFEIAKTVYLEGVRRAPTLPNQSMFVYWLSSAPEAFRDPVLAQRLARTMVDLDPKSYDPPTILASTQFRLDDPHACVAILEKDTDFDISEFIFAMALHQLGRAADARAAFDRGEKWSQAHLETTYLDRWKTGTIWHPTPGMVRRLRDEAAATLGISGEPPDDATPKPADGPSG